MLMLVRLNGAQILWAYCMLNAVERYTRFPCKRQPAQPSPSFSTSSKGKQRATAQEPLKDDEAIAALLEYRLEKETVPEAWASGDYKTDVFFRATSGLESSVTTVTIMRKVKRTARAITIRGYTSNVLS
ncbi:hypothetical protein N7454_000230 [Penicillium verhagenii]|nr:hypothetical protein N7454_000230 [Penicillium verhagenii]